MSFRIMVDDREAEVASSEQEAIEKALHLKASSPARAVTIINDRAGLSVSVPETDLEIGDLVRALGLQLKAPSRTPGGEWMRAHRR